MDEIKTSEYSSLLKEIKERIHNAQYAAFKAVNKELMGLYWDIGRMIVERQKGKTWGKAVVERLAEDLHETFPGIRGFSGRNMWRIRNLCLAYRDNPKLPLLMAEIGWTHNTVILEKCKKNQEREFYIRMTRKNGWTVNVLIHQIENQTYEKTLLSKTSFNQTLPDSIKRQAKLAVKDEYLFDFLEMGDEFDEQLLQKTLLSRMESFLREMGGLILCKSRNKTVVEYALKSTAGPMGVAHYQMMKKLPTDLESQLPSPEQVERLMGEIDA